MTCAHVLALIDVGPLAASPRAHDDAAHRHAETCAACGRAMAVAGQVARGLAEWPEVAPPPDLAAVVMARIARVDEARRTEAGELTSVSRGGMSGWAAWATTLGGLAACAALASSAAAGGGPLIRVIGPGLGSVAGGGATWPATLPEGLLLSAGLALYAVGLFAPVVSRSRR